MNIKGFSLLEVVIYVAVLAILSVGVARVVAWSVGNTLPAKARHVIASIAVDSVFTRDIRVAPYQKEKWQQMNSNFIIWQEADGTDIGWGKEGDNLIRIVGQFNQEKKKWLKKRKSIVAQGVKKTVFNITTIKRMPIVTDVFLEIVWKNNKVSTYIAQLHNKVVPKG